MLVLILGTGLYLMYGLSFMPLRRIIYSFKLLWQGRESATELDTEKRDDSRGPDRVPADGHQADAGRQQKIRNFRKRSQAYSQTGPGCYHGR